MMRPVSRPTSCPPFSSVLPTLQATSNAPPQRVKNNFRLFQRYLGATNVTDWSRVNSKPVPQFKISSQSRRPTLSLATRRAFDSTQIPVISFHTSRIGPGGGQLGVRGGSEGARAFDIAGLWLALRADSMTCGRSGQRHCRFSPLQHGGASRGADQPRWPLQASIPRGCRCANST
jgi:hypothetical protein